MCAFLRGELEKAGTEPSALRVFDLGAGNGIMGEELGKLGVHFVVGADILPAAARAAERDRPGTYRDYHVLDLTALSPAEVTMLRGYEFNALACIAALGFGDIPPECFRAAFNLLSRDSWVALNIKEGFLAETDTSGFSQLLRDAMRSGVLEVVDSRVYRHRLATNRTPLHYTGIIGRKRGEL
jgi:hypothetical protein